MTVFVWVFSDLWQRGLSLYYLDRFEEAAEQFRLDVAANPNDTEESIWCFLCEAQLYGVGLDRRPVMREAYALFKDGGDPEKLASNFSTSPGGELFYASLYAGLYYESQWFIVSAATGLWRDRDLETKMILIIVMDYVGASK
ncbi:hypothetical protein TRIUR3_26333 [Triticum urartu]|uniref:Uncharacterized protein n=2 Tax=Triticum TaxID=4564 RepID=A0A9R0UYX4_TRITD|nr:hypothetical protein TRIUR3_26333 [Triticum urartu]VAH09755.1 unnamed protein product [Triticum turgidum subsp. durum]